ncbi:MAG: hypothetical protein ABSC08_10585 [Bryobacteraceae bacterium]|jgi:hypothetical protein
MKKLIAVIVFAAFSTLCFGQATDTTKDTTKKTTKAKATKTKVTKAKKTTEEKK